MKKSLLAGLVFLLAMSCEKKQTETLSTNALDSVVVPETNEPVQSSTLQTCYVGATGKDSVFVSLDDNLGTLTGKMRYKNFEKDSSLGDVIGTKSGDTLKMLYSFESEGTQSEREIFFLQKDGNIIEGIGDHKVDGNQDKYENTANLKYDGHILKQSDCKDFEKKFSSK